MTIPEILKELELYTGKFPMKAIQTAIEQREALTPELLRVLESVAADPANWAERTDNMLPVFAIFLLAQFREKSASPLLLKILSTPGEVPFDLFGDTITEGLSQILASVYDGDAAPLHGLVESDGVNDYVRSAALDTFLVLERTGQMPREKVLEYLSSLFHGKLQRTPCYIWNCLVCTVADLPAPELLKEVRQAFAEGLVDTTFASLEGIERDATATKPWRRERLHLITDTIAEMEWWASFKPEDSSPKKLPKGDARVPLTVPHLDSDYVASQSHLREPKIGRNDPCPCGSAKKHKKCCGK